MMESLVLIMVLSTICFMMRRPKEEQGWRGQRRMEEDGEDRSLVLSMGLTNNTDDRGRRRSRDGEEEEEEHGAIYMRIPLR